ncbi:MAG: hypothetical protein HY547_07260, partial [Elusimicrobia bacterium]|nr:hypothetical protein [Elusimicrobiota bacterium]
ARVARNWRFSVIDEIAIKYFQQYKLPFKTLYDALKQADKDLLPEDELADAVDKNLSEGRMILAVLGEGIREGLRGMADMIGKSPDMLFRVALIEVGLYRVGNGEFPVVAVPTVVAETIELPRGIITVKYEQDHKPSVVATDVDNTLIATKTKGITISEGLFLQELDKEIERSKLTPNSVEAIKRCISLFKQEFEAVWNLGKTVATLHAKQNGEMFFSLYSKGHLYPSFLTLLAKRASREKLAAMRQQFETVVGKPIYSDKKAISQAYDCTSLADQKRADAFADFIKRLKSQWLQLVGSSRGKDGI